MLNVSTFRELLESACAHHGNAPFFIDDDLLGQVTYADLLQFARGLEYQLDTLGIARGAAVASIFHNCGLAALTFLAVIAARRLYVPLNPISTKIELDDMLGRSGSRAVILDPNHAKSDDFGERAVVRIHDHRNYFLERCRCGHLTTGYALGASTDSLVGEIVFTSGSTGQPKGVVLTEQNLLANARELAAAYCLRADDRFLTVCPLFHNSGQVFTTLACALVGSRTVAIRSDVGMLHFWHYADKYRPHWTLGMTSFLALLLARRDGPKNWSAMRGLLTGGSVIDAGLIQQFESRFGIPVRTVYGLTESASIATCEHIDPEPRSIGSSGRALSSCDVRIGPEPGALASSSDAPSRNPGQIWISGPTIFDRYIGDPVLTGFRKRDGWLRTGDLGYFDEHGNLFVIDRLDSMLIVGGENVYPAEVEKLCAMLPDAAQIVLAGIDHLIWGKELVLVFKPVDATTPSVSSWHRVLANHLAAFKIPQRYVALSELGLRDFPRKENGKLDRQAIAALLRSRFASSSDATSEDATRPT
jgi:acyl-CoA synthetase (AMP-forming)/AMP-acid ligase II